ncbi:hypothetical protein HOLleu_08281 [Holothuria leucospilota]|uniref:Protein FAM161A n=1 Tax=Holothuria leucospilota TaxID=206669 RepID=A0A9Q1HHR4_HOLLE|nr:hypothetical protein HOLleu_08281 [Holothuria leucospilota]
MATGHSLSVVTNSCVTLPRNPKTKLAATFDERLASDEESAEERWRWSNDYSLNWSSGESPRPSTKARPNVKPSLIENNGSQLREPNGDVLWGEREANLLASFESDDGDLSNEDFFNKLQEARKAHRESLKTLEKAYNEKLQRQKDLNTHPRSSLNYSNGFKQHTNMGTDTNLRGTDRGPDNVGDHSFHHINDELEQFAKSQPSWSALTPPVDKVRDMSTRKPPSGRPKHAWRMSSSLASSTRSSNTFKNEWSDITWTSDSDMESNSKSYGQDVKLGQSTNSTLSLSKQPDSPAVIVDNMWDDFSVDSYAPRSRRDSRVSSRSTDSKKQKKKTEWTPHITIPKPFQMTIRDSEKEHKMSRASQEIDEEIKRRLIEEEMECQKHFKATPVPATTFIPLYEDLKEQQTERSREIRLQSKQRLKEVQKPFSFVKREEKQNSLKSKVTTPKQSRTPKFKARAVPKAVFDPSVDERILEEEEYRKIRIKMRAEEMLRSSSLPPNMELKAKEYSDGKQRRKLMKKREKHAFLSDEHKFHPQINGTIPDYNDLYQKFQEEIRQKKSEKEPTVVEPFNLRTSHIPSKREKILAELQAEEDRRKEELRGLHSKTLKSSRSLSTSMDDVLPIKTTSSSILRKSMTDKALQERAESEKRQAEMERQKKLRQKQLQQSVIKKSKAHDTSQSLEATSREKIKQYREADKEREAEYNRELQEMMERIESRPLLFERESQHNAQKRAERQYIKALRSAGLDEGFLERKGGKGGIHVTKDELSPSHYSDSDSDKDLDILKRSDDDQHDTYEVDHESAGTFSSDEDD